MGLPKKADRPPFAASQQCYDSAFFHHVRISRQSASLMELAAMLPSAPWYLTSCLLFPLRVRLWRQGRHLSCRSSFATPGGYQGYFGPFHVFVLCPLIFNLPRPNPTLLSSELAVLWVSSKNRDSSSNVGNDHPSSTFGDGARFSNSGNGGSFSISGTAVSLRFGWGSCL